MLSPINVVDENECNPEQEEEQKSILNNSNLYTKIADVNDSVESKPKLGDFFELSGLFLESRVALVQPESDWLQKRHN